MITATDTLSGSYVDAAYDYLKQLTLTFGLKPGERLNEIEIAKQINISRTPLREALNRLTTEGLLKFIPGKGFFCRELDPKEIYNLFELRKLIEVGAARIAGRNVATRGANEATFDAWDDLQDEINRAAADSDVEQLVALDESFHERLVTLTGNAELIRVLRNVNERIRFVRVMASDYISDHAEKSRDHRQIIKLLREGKGEECAAVLDRHIAVRLDQITAAIREGIATIYLPSVAEPDPIWRRDIAPTAPEQPLPGRLRSRRRGD